MHSSLPRRVDFLPLVWLWGHHLSTSFTIWTWIRRRSQCTESKNRAPPTGTSSPPAITRCCCLTAKATAWRPGCGQAMCTAPGVGKNSCCPRLRGADVGQGGVFRADAAFAKPEIYEALEERGVKFATRIPANDTLERDITELLPRPVGRPSHKPVVWYKGFHYQEASWRTAWRVAARSRAGVRSAKLRSRTSR